MLANYTSLTHPKGWCYRSFMKKFSVILAFWIMAGALSLTAPKAAQSPLGCGMDVKDCPYMPI